MNKSLLKNIGIYAAIIGLFAILAYGFVPQVLDGKIVNQSDISGWKGMAQESMQWNKQHPDDKALWSDSMFGGMPTVTYMDDFQGDWTKPIYKALMLGKRPASYLFIALLGAFLMMLAFGINKYLSVIGAFAVAFCSYNMQIIQVGHNTKMQAIAFAPWVIAALVFTYRTALGERGKTADAAGGWKDYLPMTVLGSVLFSLALSMQIKANHVQITYYLAIVILLYALATLIYLAVKKDKLLLKRFAVASALLLAVGLVGIGTNANKLMPTAAYAPFTMRGGSELRAESNEEQKADDAGSRGLDLDYATQWSYAPGELPNLMIPNYNGGSSHEPLAADSFLAQSVKEKYRAEGYAISNADVKKIVPFEPLYWGPQPGTAGPMYMGVITIFLFLLGLCLCKGRERWWLLACCVVAAFLAFGRHTMWFTEFMFKYAPMYNKFRTVSMALVVLQFCMPVLGIYALDRIFKGHIPPKDVVRAAWISLAVTAGFCALVALVPSVAGDFTQKEYKLNQDTGRYEYVDQETDYPEEMLSALQADRRLALQKDAWRSFLLVVLCAAAIIFCYWKVKPGQTQKRYYMAAGFIFALVVFDLWFVGKRYLNDEHFVTPKNFDAQFKQRPADKKILEDTDPSYRVLDLSTNTFNSSVTSFRHKSIGGYSPTKMQRYQDLIDYCLGPEIYYASECIKKKERIPYLPVLNMLATKYIIVTDKDTLHNDFAYKSAWFVDSLEYVSSANDELYFLLEAQQNPVIYGDYPDQYKETLLSKAVVRSDKGVAKFGGSNIDDAEIYMTYYSPNELHYSYSCAEPSAVVFSEIYHPSWKATVNGEPLELFQADWVLRGAILPAGDGEIIMRYEPKDYVTGRRLSTACSIALLLLLLGAVAPFVVGRILGQKNAISVQNRDFSAKLDRK